MSLIDLTQSDVTVRAPLVGIVTRFPPSESASASAALELSARLAAEHGFSVEVIRLVARGDAPAEGHPVIMDVDPHWHMSAELAARRASRSDVVIVQVDRHVPLEQVDELISGLDVPVVLSIDDVGSPGSVELSRIGALAGKADVCVVPSETARGRLRSEAPASAEVRVIPHGSPWRALAPPNRLRRGILSWGFMVPGMGAERVVRSLALMGDLSPRPRYRLVGVADPGWSRREATAYRLSLSKEAERIGVAGQLDLVSVLHSWEGLQKEIQRCDVIAVVYDSADRACSRILTEAVSTGRPVVATEFPGAVEMLATGAGTTVAHEDAQALADALRTYLTDDSVYEHAAEAASTMGARLSWEVTAREFAGLLSEQLGRRGQPAGVKR